MLSLTMDNASVNGAMMRGIAWILQRRYSIELIPEQSQGRCLAHVLNLVCQDVFHTLKEADDPDKVDYYHLFHRADPIHFNEDQAELEEDEGEDDGSGEKENQMEMEMEVDDQLDAFLQEFVQAEDDREIEKLATDNPEHPLDPKEVVTMKSELKQVRPRLLGVVAVARVVAHVAWSSFGLSVSRY
jgi:hypothetical protein